MRILKLTAALFLIISPLQWAQAGDIEAGKTKSAQCVVCHGQNGISTMIGAPNLAGQSEIYLQQQLLNYRSGKRSHQVMSIIAKPLSDKEIDDLSAWYSAFKIEVTMPK